MAAHHERRGDPIEDALLRARAILPDQGPMNVFIHHNTLHAFQSMDFHEGVQQGCSILGARPYPELSFFRKALAEGRIEAHDLAAEIERELNLQQLENRPHSLAIGVDRRDLWNLLWKDAPDSEDEAEIAGIISSQDSSRHRDWHIACERVRKTPPSSTASNKPRRHRDLLHLEGLDPDQAVHSELIRLCAVFLDRGQAAVPMPGKRDGFYKAAGRLLALAAESQSLGGVRADFRGWLRMGNSPRQVIIDVLEALDVPASEREEFLFATLLALPGWAGMFSRLESHPDEAPKGVPVSLLEFLAVRLALDRRATERSAQKLGRSHRWPQLLLEISTHPRCRIPFCGWLLLEIADFRKIPAESRGAWITGLPDSCLNELWQEVDAFSSLQRRKIGLEAYERRYRRQILDSIAASKRIPKSQSQPLLRGQFIFCMDEREESLRRAVEEQGPQYTTFGAAGFFGMAVHYRGLEDESAAPYCPVAVTPVHEVHERSRTEDLAEMKTRQRRIGQWKKLEGQAGRASRGILGGIGVSLLLGPAAGLLALQRVLFPRSSLKWIRRLEDRLAPLPRTELTSLRSATDPKEKLGFSVEEAADRVAATLFNMGLVREFAPIIVLLGHGSTSLNNPHESAHDCGACGGRRGGANARLFADLANRPEVRSALRTRGITIPENVRFIGGLHDTSDDRIELYDTDLVPEDSKNTLTETIQVLERARRENALERARRFEITPLDSNRDQALRDVELRASNLGQPRPEYGHCTNAVCIIGRRSVTRGLHLDRRAFLVSYDASFDPENRLVERILAAVGPVGAGISLEYYFSSVDNEVLGCGTKLPHNVTGWLGVMNGHKSDLRTGLPLQMVEIHEPMRLLVIVEATTDALLQVASRQAEVRELVVNRWIQLVSLNPSTGEMQEFRDGAFSTYLPQAIDLPQVSASPDWNRRFRGHLPPAWVERGHA